MALPGAPHQVWAENDSGGTSSVLYKGKKGYKMVREYLMGDVIGEGTQGKVRQALHSETLRRVAIKIVNVRQLRKVRNAEEMMRREVAIHRKLKHANVVELMEDFRVEEKDKWYVVMELVAGGSLQDMADVVPDHVLPEALACRLARQLFVGLDYCHSKGVVHRDIKPSNLMVTADGLLKICDFGVAEELDKFEGSDTCTKSRGSPAFQAPEVASGQHCFSGFKVDVWAAGISLYLITSGRVPFEGSSLINLFENIAAGQYPIPARIAHNTLLVELLRGVLKVAQEDRFGVKDVLRHRWFDRDLDHWSGEYRAIVQQAAGMRASTRSDMVLRAIARKYGEEFTENSEGIRAESSDSSNFGGVAVQATPFFPPRDQIGAEGICAKPGPGDGWGSTLSTAASASQACHVNRPLAGSGDGAYATAPGQASAQQHDGCVLS